MVRVEQSNTIKQKREALALAECVGVKRAGEQLSIARPTIYDLRNQAEDIWSFKGHSTSKTLKGQGCKEIFPGVSELVTYMKDVLSTAGMIQFMWTIHPEWMASYVARSSDGGDYSSYEGGGVLNVDETAILFDMPPTRSWAGKGRKDSARVLEQTSTRAA
eukprot:jgi/Phyca11/115430/e_gw1.28.261.1